MSVSLLPLRQEDPGNIVRASLLPRHDAAAQHFQGERMLTQNLLRKVHLIKRKSVSGVISQLVNRFLIWFIIVTLIMFILCNTTNCSFLFYLLIITYLLIINNYYNYNLLIICKLILIANYFKITNVTGFQRKFSVKFINANNIKKN